MNCRYHFVVHDIHGLHKPLLLSYADHKLIVPHRKVFLACNECSRSWNKWMFPHWRFLSLFVLGWGWVGGRIPACFFIALHAILDFLLL